MFSQEHLKQTTDAHPLLGGEFLRRALSRWIHA
jgi:hypothetical protein